MKKISVILSLFTIVLLAALGVIGLKGGQLPLVITLGVLFIIFMSYFYFEKSSMGTKEIALIATLSAFAAVSRIPFAAIPGVQPTTFLVALSGYVFGAYQGFLVGSTSAFISNIFLGQGPWTPWQMFAWGIVGALSGFIGKKANLSGEKFAVICFLYGFLFDWIMNLWHVIGFISPINIKTIALAYLTGLTMDIMHAAGNFIFALIFFEHLKKVLVRFKKRLEVTYVK